MGSTSIPLSTKHANVEKELSYESPETIKASFINSSTPPTSKQDGPASIRINRSFRSNVYSKPKPAERQVFEIPVQETLVQLNSVCPICNYPLVYNGSACPNCSGPSTCDRCNGLGCIECGVAGSPGDNEASCPSCGVAGCHDPDSLADQIGDCGSVTSATRYMVAEALYLTRLDGVISNSNFGALSNFDWQGGFRMTLGDRRDSIHGREFSYAGTGEITEEKNHFDPIGRINARFNAGDGFLPAEISAFKNAVEQVEFKQTEFHSFELSRVKWGWDVVKNYMGLRYIYNGDSYNIASRNVFDENGFFEVDVSNNLIGPNIGSEIYYDVGHRLSGTFIIRGGLYASINQVRTRLQNAGTQFLDVEDDNSTLGGSFELGLNGRFKIIRRVNLRFGYNLMWLDGVAEAANNVPPVLTPSTGSDTSDSNQMQFHGASFGFEIFR